MKLRFLLTSLLVLTALMGGPETQQFVCQAGSRPSAAASKNEVPFQLCRGNAIVVRGSVGNLKNLNFLVDTGAVPGVLDQRIARKLHLAGETVQISALTKNVGAQWVDAPEVAVGPVFVEKLRVVVRDLSFASDALGTRIDAMIGFDLLGQTPFTIDYEAKKILFGPIDPSLATISYHPGLPYVLVDLQIHGEKLALLVDTGTSDLLLFESAVRNCLSTMRLTRAQNWSNMGGEMHVSRAQLADAHLGDVQWGQRLAYILKDGGEQPFGIAGLLGTTQLSTKRVAFDPIRNLIAWAPMKESQ